PKRFAKWEAQKSPWTASTCSIKNLRIVATNKGVLSKEISKGLVYPDRKKTEPDFEACKFSDVWRTGYYAGLDEEQTKAKIAGQLADTPFNVKHDSDDSDVDVEASPSSTTRLF
ncbi:MAG: hypothetical protein Q9183_006066, partial [Haloplaca sp. 2 TL-2023]